MSSQTTPAVVSSPVTSPAVSAPAWRYAGDSASFFAFLEFIINQVKLSDTFIAKILEVLDASPGEQRALVIDDELFQKLKLAFLGSGGSERDLARHAPFLFEMLFCRAIDNYLTYISELLALIYTTRPEMLRSKETVTIEDVLQCSSMEEFIARQTEQKVLDLSYKGIRKLDEYLQKRMKFCLFVTADDLEVAARIMEKRNLVVHNRGSVNRKFLKMVPNSSKQLGQKIEILSTELKDELDFLMRSVVDLDNRAVKQFGIPITAIPV